MQDTFERALRYLAAGHLAPRNPRAWLQSILRNIFVDRTRRARAANQTPFVALEEWPAPEPTAEPPWAACSMQDILQGLEMLAPEQRAAFELHYLHGLPYAEVAAVLKISGNTVASRLYRARQTLQRALTQRAVASLGSLESLPPAPAAASSAKLDHAPRAASRHREPA